MKLRAALVKHAETLAGELLAFVGPADQTVSRYFRTHRQLGQNDRAFVAEAVYAVLRRRRSLEAAAASETPRALLLAALSRVQGFSARALEVALRPADAAILARSRAAKESAWPAAVRADLPDWLWLRLEAEQGAVEAMRIAQGLLNPAPLDLRVNLARIDRDGALASLAASGLTCTPTPYSPAGIRL
ncbi:MAG: SAM-dependent methyltransferase, partial [Burkholderiales bacterium]